MSVIQNKLKVNQLDFTLSGNKVTIVPGETTTSYSLSLPINAGYSNQVLNTDGTGILSWVNQNCPLISLNMFNFLANPTSANLMNSISDETGTGALVFANGPTMSNVICTGLLNADSITTNQTIFNAANQVVNKQYIDSSVGAITLQTSGVGVSLLSSTINPIFITKGLIAGANITLTSDANAITIDAATATVANSGTAGSVSLLNPLGTHPNYLTKGLKVSGLTLGTTNTDITLSTKGINQQLNSIYSANAQLPTGARTYYYQFWAQSDGTLSDICLWVSTVGTSSIRVGIYKGTLSPLTSTLVAFSNIIPFTSFTSGRNKIPLVNVVSGQNLDVTKDQALILVYTVSGVNTRLYATTGNSDVSMSYYSNGYSNPLPATVPAAGNIITQKGVFTVNYI